MSSLFALRHKKILFLSILITLLSIIVPVSAGESISDAVSWNISTNTYPTTVIGAEAHVDALSWWLLFCIGILLFVISLKWTVEQGSDVLAGISLILFGYLSLTAFAVQTWTYEVVSVQLNNSAEFAIMPVVYSHPAWPVLITVLLFVLGVINLYRIHINTMLKTADDVGWRKS